MLTFKQVEAVYWIVQLGSFEAAANKLNASQSAISKRVQELEQTFSLEVFDRSKRTAKLTEKGEELYLYAKELLEKRDEAVERLSAKEVLVRRFRLGVTELTALTWLPRLVAAIKKEYPRVIVEAEVELGATLRERLAAQTIDFIIVPGASATERYVSTRLAFVENAWMCVPSMAPAEKRIPLTEISNFPLLSQGDLSGTGVTYSRFLVEHGVNAAKGFTSNNLVAQIGLTLSGIGVSYLPTECFHYLVADGTLQKIETDPPLPPIEYVAMYRADHAYALTAEIAQLAATHCDFSKLLLQPG
ncbi:LysR family transcriptional regulator [Cupriavidus taiwanensis]|uniref:LysR family transcriptional regulator n=1 Tax=Cupriavidus taiwanensis TaxID=164546 RepID=UPI000E17045A|nr:LysR family transcriptional regulator [Cupriavidus taiwanensis]SOY93304.1 LysR family transcriptional regulator [Cupriavidus taiwanensis]SOY96450.1 LysR family transcriptional regulator [Cupriavidus taiwanensis]